MRTLHVDLGRQWRGGQKQALLLMRGLRAQEHTAALIAAAHGGLATRARAEGFTTYPVSTSLPRLHAALVIRTLVRQLRPAVVHCHDAHGLMAAWLAGAHKHTAVVASRRVAYRLAKAGFGLRHYRSARRVVAVSKFVANTVLASGLPADQVEVIYDGVESAVPVRPEERAEARRRWNAGDGPLLGCVGYLLPEKGQGLLIEALPLLRRQHRDCRLLLAGDGPCRKDLEELAAQLGVRNAVVFAGLVDDVAQVYRALDLFVFPSIAEPLGSALLDAMAYGLPVVAAGGGAVPEIIDDGANGLLVHDRDAGAFAAAIGTLLGDAGLACALGDAGRATVEQRFSAERMVQDTLDLYLRLAGER